MGHNEVVYRQNGGTTRIYNILERRCRPFVGSSIVSLQVARLWAAETVVEIIRDRARIDCEELFSLSNYRIYRHILHILIDKYAPDLTSSRVMTCELCESRFTCVCNLEYQGRRGLQCYRLPFMLNLPLNDLYRFNNALGVIQHVHSLKRLFSESAFGRLNGKHYRFMPELRGGNIFIPPYAATTRRRPRNIVEAFLASVDDEILPEDGEPLTMQPPAIFSLENHLTAQYTLRQVYDMLTDCGHHIYTQFSMEEVNGVILRPLNSPAYSTDILYTSTGGLFEPRAEKSYFTEIVDVELVAHYLTTIDLQGVQLSRNAPDLLSLLFPLFFPYGGENWAPRFNRYQEGDAKPKIFGFEDVIDDENTDAFIDPRNRHFTAAKYFKWVSNVSPEILLGPLGQEFISTLYDLQQQIYLGQYKGTMLTNDVNDRAGRAAIVVPPSLKGSAPYWRKKLKELEAMAARLGAGTFFLTMTANLDWDEIQERKLTDSPLDDPVIVEQVFEEKLQSFYSKLKHNLIFPEACYIAHWGRVEYQKRGLPHTHIIIWLDISAEENSREWQQFMDRYIKTDFNDFHLYYPETDTMNRDFPSLNQLLFLEKMQRAHTHNHTPDYCMKSGHCRFHFPKPPIDTTHSVNGRVLHTRLPENSMIVEHCPKIISDWKGHVNMTAIGKYSNLTYLTAYAAKGEPLETAKYEQSIFGDRYDSYTSYCQDRMITTPEMIRHLLGYHFVSSSHAFIHLPTVPEEFRWHAVTEQQRHTDFEARIDNLELYFTRSNDFANDLYTDFYEHHSFYRIKDEGVVTYRMRNRVKPTIAIVTVPAMHETEKFWFHWLVTKIAWKDKQHFLDAVRDASDIGTYEAAGRRMVTDVDDTLAMVLTEWVSSQALSDMTMRRYLLRSINDEQTWEDVRMRVIRELHRDIGNYSQARLENAFFEYNSGCQENFECLTQEQRRIAEACSHMRIDSRLKVLIEGPAGTGKSFLLKAIVGKLHEKNLNVVVVAPTGIAAVNVGGRTIHSQFIINTDNQFSDVDNNEVLREFILNTHVLVIEEYSMIHYDLWNSLNFLFRRVRGGPHDFGGINILCFGDRRQLPPISENDSGHLLHCGVLSDFIRCTLKTPMRSVCLKLDKLLKAVSNPLTKQQYVKTLLRSVKKMPTVTQGLVDELLSSDGSVRLITPHTLVRNEISTLITATALKNLRRHHIRNAESSFANYSKRITLFGTGEVLHLTSTYWLNEQVIITKNIDVSAGLVNGAVGRILHLGMNFITVQLNHDNGVHQISFTEHSADICHNNTVLRARVMEIPLEQAYVSTVHKCQGQTLDRVYIDIRDPHFSHGMFYTALSRVRRIEDITLLGSMKYLAYTIDESLFADGLHLEKADTLIAPLTPYERFTLRLDISSYE